MSRPILVYGAYGYTGELVARHALERGLQVIVAGRDPERLERVARALDCESRPFPLTDAEALRRGIRGASAVVHCAGPFASTAAPVAEACIDERIHYLDVTGEVPALAVLHALGPTARNAGVMLLPAAGFDVVPSDCLAAHLVRRLPGARSLTVAIGGLDEVSRGTARTFLESIRAAERAGAPRPRTRTFDLGAGPVKGIEAPWADVFTAPRSTGVAEVQAYSLGNVAMRATHRVLRRIAPRAARGAQRPLGVPGAWRGGSLRGPARQAADRRLVRGGPPIRKPRGRAAAPPRRVHVHGPRRRGDRGPRPPGRRAARMADPLDGVWPGPRARRPGRLARGASVAGVESQPPGSPRADGRRGHQRRPPRSAGPALRRSSFRSIGTQIIRPGRFTPPRWCDPARRVLSVLRCTNRNRSRTFAQDRDVRERSGMFTFDSCSPGFTFLKVDGTSDQAFRRLFRHAARGSGSRLRLLRLGCPPDFRREILAKVGASGEENACCLLLQDAIPSVEILLPDPSAEPFLTRMDAESRSPWHMWRIAREVVELVSHLLEIRKQRARPDSLRVGFHQTGLLWNMGIVGDREILFRPYGAKTGHDPSNADFYLSHGAPREVRRAFVSYYERVRSDAKTRFFSSREEFEDLFRSWRWPTLFKGNAVRSRRKDRDKSEHEGALDDSCVYKACCTPASTAAERAIYEGVGRSGGHRYLRVPDIRSIRNVPWRNGCLCIQRIQGCTLFELVSHVQQMGAEGPGKRDQSELILGVIVEQALLALDEFTAAARRLLSGRTATYPYAERMSSALADVVRFCGSITEAEVASGLADLRKLGRELQKSATVPFRDAHLKNRILEHGERSTRTAAEKLFGLSSEALESFLGENTFDIDFEMSNLLVTEWEDPVHLLCFEECGLAKVRDAGELEEFIRSWMPDRRLRPLWEDLFWKTLLARATREHCRRIWYANVMPLSHTKRYLHERRDQFLDLALRAASRISGLLGLKQCLQRFKESPAEMWPRSMRCRRAEPIAAKPPPARAGAWSPCKRPVGRAHPGPLDELLANSGELVESVRALRRQLSEQDGRVEHRFDRLDAAGRRLMKKVKAGYAGLIRTLLDEGMEGPRLFSLEPVEPGFLDHPGWMGEKFRLTLWCEHSRLPLPALNGKGDRRGVYEMTFPREWFVQVAPFLKLLTRTLSLMVPVASSATKLTIGDETYEGILKQLDLGERIADAILKGGEQAASSLGSEAPRIQVGEAIDARGAALRMLQSLLKRKDPTFGGLERVQKKGRECLWVHPQFVKEYRRR